MINLQSTLFLDLFPGPSGSFPAFLHVHGEYLYFSSSGIDTSWMIEYDHTDSCNSYKQSTYDQKIFYAVSESTYWDVARTYDCPLGFHWASTQEGFQHFNSHTDADVEEYWHAEEGSESHAMSWHICIISLSETIAHTYTHIHIHTHTYTYTYTHTYIYIHIHTQYLSLIMSHLNCLDFFAYFCHTLRCNG